MTLFCVSKERVLPCFLTICLSILMLGIFIPASAHAACTNPTGGAGDLVYNYDFRIMQFCNGTRWIATSSYRNDGVPDAFDFTDVTGAALSTLTTSNTVTIEGIGGVTDISLSGDGSPEMNINGAGWVTSGTINEGQTLQLRLTSSASYETELSATIEIGGISDMWTVITSVGPGQIAYTSPGTFNWTVPSGVTSVSVVAIGAGGGGDVRTFAASSTSGLGGGGGGALAYRNNITVTPGDTITVTVGTGGPNNSAGGNSSFGTSVIAGGGGAGGLSTDAQGGNIIAGVGGGSGGRGGGPTSSLPLGQAGGGGGSGGYTGAGGTGGIMGSPGFPGPSGGATGGSSGSSGSPSGAWGGGSIGIFGNGSTGGSPGRGAGGSPGGGGGGGWSDYGHSAIGGNGAVRIIWPGDQRQFPSTRTADE